MGDNKEAAKSYILTFYENVQMFTRAYAEYCDLIVGMSKSLSEEQGEALTIANSQIRQMAIQAEMHYTMMCEQLHITPDKDMPALLEHVQTAQVLERKELRKFCIILNKFVLNQVISSLLETSMQISNEAFDGASNQS